MGHLTNDRFMLIQFSHSQQNFDIAIFHNFRRCNNTYTYLLHSFFSFFFFSSPSMLLSAQMTEHRDSITIFGPLNKNADFYENGILKL